MAEISVAIEVVSTNYYAFGTIYASTIQVHGSTASNLHATMVNVQPEQYEVKHYQQRSNMNSCRLTIRGQIRA